MTAIKKPLTAVKASEQESRKKWGNELIEAGYTIFPSTLLRRQSALGLDPIHVNILMLMFTYWWTADNLPYPSKNTMAEAIGVDPSTVRRRIKQLEELKFIKRIERRKANDRSDTNQYSFKGLIKALKPFAEEEIEAKDAAKLAKAKRMARKKPALSMVKK